MTTIKLEDIQNAAQTTQDAVLSIEVSNENPLAIGSHTFALKVVDDSGNESLPAQIVVIVRDTERPTAVIRAADSRGRPLPNNTLSFGASFMLNGEQSLDAPPGTISKYIWTLVNQ